jgi:hypothetical protein
MNAAPSTGPEMQEAEPSWPSEALRGIHTLGECLTALSPPRHLPYPTLIRLQSRRSWPRCAAHTSSWWRRPRGPSAPVRRTWGRCVCSSWEPAPSTRRAPWHSRWPCRGRRPAGGGSSTRYRCGAELGGPGRRPSDPPCALRGQEMRGNIRVFCRIRPPRPGSLSSDEPALVQAASSTEVSIRSAPGLAPKYVYVQRSVVEPVGLSHLC